MLESLSELPPGLVALATLAVAGVAFAVGVRTGRRGRREPRPGPGGGSATAQRIRDRFSDDQHRAFLRRAIANSRRAGIVDRTGGPFGAVIVDREGQVVADGSNQVVARNDPTCHAEVEAIRSACRDRQRFKLDGCILYTSAEPCPMCLAAAYWAGLDGIVYASGVEDAATYGGFDDDFIYRQFSTPPDRRRIPQIQLLREEAVAVWEEYAAQPGNVPY